MILLNIRNSITSAKTLQEGHTGSGTWTHLLGGVGSGCLLSSKVTHGGTEAGLTAVGDPGPVKYPLFLHLVKQHLREALEDGHGHRGQGVCPWCPVRDRGS